MESTTCVRTFLGETRSFLFPMFLTGSLEASSKELFLPLSLSYPTFVHLLSVARSIKCFLRFVYHSFVFMFTLFLIR